jgi:hypothetical protein
MGNEEIIFHFRHISISVKAGANMAWSGQRHDANGSDVDGL